MAEELVILWHETPPPNTDARIIDTPALRREVLSGRLVGSIGRYRRVRLRTPVIDAAPQPFYVTLIARYLSRGRCVIEETRFQREVPIGVRFLVSKGLAYLRDTWRRKAFLATVAGDIRQLSSPRRQPPQRDLSLPVLYLRTDQILGVRSGGSVGHIAGVLNHFGELTGPPVFLSTDTIPTVRPDIETHLIPPDSRFRDFAELSDLWGNRVCVAASQRHVGQRDLSFVYQRYSLHNYAGLKYARQRGVPFVLEFNGSEVWIAQNWGRPLKYRALAEKIELLCVRGADLVVVVSRPIKDELVARGVDAERILVNPNGVDAQRYRPDVDGGAVRARYGLEGKTVIGFIGTFGPWHGAEVLADAFGRLIARNPKYRQQVRLLMVGDGGGMPQVRANLERHGAGDLCTLTGLVPQAEGPAHLAAMDIFASPHVPNSDGTPFFGSPTKLFEYMAMGRGIVASNLDQIGEVLRHGDTAWMVPPGNAQALVAGLAHLIEHPELRAGLGAAARQDAVARFTWREHTRRIVEALAGVSQGPFHDSLAPVGRGPG